MPQSQLVQVSIAGAPDALLATFLDDSATALQLIEQLMREDGARIRQSVLGSSADDAAELRIDQWAIQHCISSSPNAERSEQELQELEERASWVAPSCCLSARPIADCILVCRYSYS